jgi:fused signal recognition particle receptor
MQDPLLAAALALAAVAVVIAVVGLFLYLRRRSRRVDSLAKAGAAPGLGPGERLRAALAKTRDVLRERLAGSGRDRQSEDYLAGIEEALLVADVGVRTTESMIARLRKEVTAGDTGEDVARILGGVLREILEKPAEATIVSPTGNPRVVLVAGVNGVGKTTTIGKLAARYVKEGLQVLLVAADTFRAAAGEQLERWGRRVGAEVIVQKTGADPAAVVVDGLRAARTRGTDVVIIDTAGRLHTKKNLMEELSKVRRVTARECPGAPHETLLVLDATTGQNGLQQALIFKDALEVSGVVLTKMDGTARGGVAVSVVAELGIPVRFIGLGEGPEDLADFSARDFVEALLEPETGTSGSAEADEAR